MLVYAHVVFDFFVFLLIYFGIPLTYNPNVFNVSINLLLLIFGCGLIFYQPNKMKFPGKTGWLLNNAVE
jgi:hypothetical protein